MRGLSSRRKFYSPEKGYADSKVAQILFTTFLNEKLRDKQQVLSHMVRDLK